LYVLFVYTHTFFNQKKKKKEKKRKKKKRKKKKKKKKKERRGEKGKKKEMQDLAAKFKLTRDKMAHCPCADVQAACTRFRDSSINPWSGRTLSPNVGRYNQIAEYCTSQSVPIPFTAREKRPRKGVPAQSGRLLKKTRKAVDVPAAAAAAGDPPAAAMAGPPSTSAAAALGKQSDAIALQQLKEAETALIAQIRTQKAEALLLAHQKSKKAEVDEAVNQVRLAEQAKEMHHKLLELERADRMKAVAVGDVGGLMRTAGVRRFKKLQKEQIERGKAAIRTGVEKLAAEAGARSERLTQKKKHTQLLAQGATKKYTEKFRGRMAARKSEAQAKLTAARLAEEKAKQDVAAAAIETEKQKKKADDAMDVAEAAMAAKPSGKPSPAVAKEMAIVRELEKAADKGAEAVEIATIFKQGTERGYKLEVRESAVIGGGRGLFTMTKIPKGKVICSYIGPGMKIYTKKEHDKLIPSGYARELTSDEICDLDGDPDMSKKPFGIFANNSPLYTNATISNSKKGDVWSINLTSRRAIGAGEEIFAPYGGTHHLPKFAHKAFNHLPTNRDKSCHMVFFPFFLFFIFYCTNFFHPK
jgi:hypothetical protein